MTNTIHKVPAEVAVAIQTKRTLFLKMLKQRIKEKPETVTAEEIIGVIDMVQEYIEDQPKFIEELRRLHHSAFNVIGNAKKTVLQVAQLRAMMDGTEPPDDFEQVRQHSD